eukprot:COSAG03_NODE_11702_length_579_cov_7639.685417_2_plen_49_part_01
MDHARSLSLCVCVCVCVFSHLALTGLAEIFSEAKGNLVCASDLPPGRGM